MRALVMKFGGSCVCSIEQFHSIASLILTAKRQYDNIVVVVSAMGDTTNQLLSLAHLVNPNPPPRECDMLLTIGERVSMSLLAMAIAHQGGQASSLTGSQTGILTTDDHTNANIIDIRPKRLLSILDQGMIGIVAGFQGVSQRGEITTLGRGGSDTTAVALAVALQTHSAISSTKTLFFKDVPALFSHDPKKEPHATSFSHATYDQALNIVKQSGTILHPRSITLAKKNALPLQILSLSDAINSLHNFEKLGTKIEDHSISQRQLTPQYEEEVTCSSL